MSARIPSTSYRAVHHRLRARRGPAAEQACVDCGGPAAHWSYEGGCPDERTGETWANGRLRPVTWGLTLARYVPRCASCHRRHDIAAQHAAALDLLLAIWDRCKAVAS